MKDTKKQVVTLEIREQLKAIVQEEISLLSENLKEMDTKDKLNLIIKLLPFTLPKVQPCDMEYGEPLDFKGF